MKNIISIIGKTNVGKSTLFNKIIEKKYSVVNKKKHTTIRSIECISKKYTIIDTPGIITKKNIEVGHITNNVIYDTIKKSQTILIIITNKLDANDFFLMEIIKKLKKRSILIISKIDKIKKLNLLNIIKNITRYKTFQEIIPVSAKKNINIESVKKILYTKKEIFELIRTENEIRLLLKDITRKELLSK